MMEDGLEDVKNLVDKGKQDENEELKEDSIGTKYLKLVNNVSISELCNFTVELPVSKHCAPEVKAAKMSEIRNLQDYETFEEVPDEGQDTAGS